MVFLEFHREVLIPLELRRGPQGTFNVASGKSGLCLSFEGHLRIPLESLNRKWVSS